MVVKIFVGNLHVESTPSNEASLRRQFEQFGRVVECDILTGKSYGFVHMESEDEAQVAISRLNGEILFGSPMNVEMSANQKRGRRPPTGGPVGRGGSRGGRGGGGFGRRDDRSRDSRSGGRGRYDPYSRNGSDAYARDPPYDRLRSLYGRDPARDAYARYAREAYARDLYAQDVLEREPYMREMHGRGPYGSRRGDDDDMYGRPTPDYFRRQLASREAAEERGLVSYPMPKKSSSYGLSLTSSKAADYLESRVQPTMYGRPQTSSLYTGFD